MESPSFLDRAIPQEKRHPEFPDHQASALVR